MYPHHVFDLEPAGTFGMYPICYRQVSGRYFQLEPAIYSRCFRWFPGPLTPSEFFTNPTPEEVGSIPDPTLEEMIHTLNPFRIETTLKDCFRVFTDESQPPPPRNDTEGPQNTILQIPPSRNIHRWVVHQQRGNKRPSRRGNMVQ